MSVMRRHLMKKAAPNQKPLPATADSLRPSASAPANLLGVCSMIICAWQKGHCFDQQQPFPGLQQLDPLCRRVNNFFLKGFGAGVGSKNSNYNPAQDFTRLALPGSFTPATDPNGRRIVAVQTAEPDDGKTGGSGFITKPNEVSPPPQDKRESWQRN